MSLYDVHIYATARIKVAGVEADSQPDAIREALDLVEITPLLRCGDQIAKRHGAVEVDDAEEITGFLVDEVGDEDFRNSRSYGPDGVTPERPAALHSVERLNFDPSVYYRNSLIAHCKQLLWLLRTSEQLQAHALREEKDAYWARGKKKCYDHIASRVRYSLARNRRALMHYFGTIDPNVVATYKPVYSDNNQLENENDGIEDGAAA